MFCVVLGLAGATVAQGQMVGGVVNADGASITCVGLGLGMLIEKKCVSNMEKVGFLKKSDVGALGFTVGTEAAQDGVVTEVDPSSSAAKAGVKVGDVVVGAEGKPTKRTASNVLEQLAYGPVDEPLKITLKRDGKEVPMEFARVKREPPPDLPKGSIFMAIRNLINWRGEDVPCMGAGAEMMAPAIVLCTNHFKPQGFVQVSKYAGTGFIAGPGPADDARVTEVTAGSPAAAAGLKAGDEVVAVDGKPLTGSAGRNAEYLLFGRKGQERKMQVRRGDAVQEIRFTLEAQKKG